MSSDQELEVKQEAGAVPTGRTSTSSSMTPLQADFEPGPDDVVCGRGKKCYNHIGNDRFRQRVLTFLDEYSRAKSKLDKSTVLSKVVEEVRQNSPHGGFVKQDTNGRWYEVGDFLAREKTSQAFRDALHDRYKSSNISKKKRRQEEQAKASHVYNRIIRSEYEISSRLERLSNEVLGNQDLQSLENFNRANYEMLSRLNRQSRHPGAESSRRYSISRSFDYPSVHEKSISHLPDPLFGSAMNSANAMPSNFAGERLSPSHQGFSRQRTHSFASAPDVGGEPLATEKSKVKALHNSLPDVHLDYLDARKDPFDDSLTLHRRSVPDLALSKHGMEEDTKIPAKEMVVEPVPYHRVHLPGRTKSAPEIPVKKPFPQRAHEAAAAAEMQVASSSSSNRSNPDRNPERISKDLLECLDKMTYHSIADDNPFEPIPLTPEQEKALSARKKITSDVPIFNPLDDMSEQDEFAEG